MADRQGVAILGSTGSVGSSALDVISSLPDQFEVVALAAGANHARLQEQIDRFTPQYASLDSATAQLSGASMIDSDDPLLTMATLPEVDIVVVSTTGHTAIPAVLAALEAGKVVALANKETVVAAGQLVMEAAQHALGELRPVDSEHSALWQAMGQSTFDPKSMTRLVLTASGGPFRTWPNEKLLTVTPEDALDHPTWSMGRKITIDSATLMNKGFELIEAAWIFDCPIDAIDVVVHPQSVVHSLVEFVDGSVIAQLGPHDMRMPIQYALTAPERAPSSGPRLALHQLGRLEFEAPDHERFPALNLCRESLIRGGLAPAILSAADEVAVDAFLRRSISFPDIVSVCEKTLDKMDPMRDATYTLEDVMHASQEASRVAQMLVREYGRR